MTMIRKFFLTLTFLILLQWNSLNVNAAPVQQKESYYFKEFLNQKGTLLHGNENEVCFRISLVTHKDYANMRFITPDGRLNDQMDDKGEFMVSWAFDNMQKWEFTKTVIKHIFGYSMCDFFATEYIFQYDLPPNWESGAELNLLDEFVIVARRLFWVNRPESCKDGKKFNKFLPHMMKKLKFSDETVYPLDGEDVFLTVKVCLPLKKYSEVPDFVYVP